MPQPIHTGSNIHDTTHDIGLHSDTSNSDPISSQFSSPTASQGQLKNFERLLSQAHWNHSFNVVNSSPSFQSSLPLSFLGTPPIITLSSNSPDPDQHSHHCIGKQPDTKRTYATLPLKLDPKFFVPPPYLFGVDNNGEKLLNWAKQRIFKSYKITPVQRQRAHEILKQSKITFSVEIIVGQDNLIFPPQAAAPPVFLC